MITATVKVKVSDAAMARSLIKSVEPDNVNMKGLTVNGRASAKRASFNISYNGKIETFISTLEDMLRCIQAAEGILQKITKNKME